MFWRVRKLLLMKCNPTIPCKNWLSKIGYPISLRLSPSRSCSKSCFLPSRQTRSHSLSLFLQDVDLSILIWIRPVSSRRCVSEVNIESAQTLCRLNGLGPSQAPVAQISSNPRAVILLHSPRSLWLYVLHKVRCFHHLLIQNCPKRVLRDLVGGGVVGYINVPDMRWHTHTQSHTTG